MVNDIQWCVSSVTKEVYDKKSGQTTIFELTPDEYLLECADHMYYRYVIKSSSTTRLWWESSPFRQSRYLAKVSESNGIIIRYTLNALNA